MNGKDLIINTFKGEPVERAPWVPYTGVQIARLKGYDAQEILMDGDKLLECLLESNKQYSPDGQPVVFDLQIEAEILGCELLWAKDSPPTVKSHPLADTKEIPLKIPSRTEGRLPMVLDVMKRMKAEVGNTTALYGLVCGPFTLASHLRSTNIFMDMYDDEEYVKKLISYATDVAIAVTDLYIESGMDIIGSVDPLVSQISPEMFTQFMASDYKRFFDHVRSKGAFSSFFVCGDATKNLEAMALTGPDCLSIDENIDIVEAKKITDAHHILISGNLQLTVVMLLGNQKDCQKAALDLMDKMGTKGFILAPGCDMPYGVPVENIVGVGQAVQNPEATRSFLSSYVKEVVDIDVDMPDYENLDYVLIEVLTIDSATCAACGYMKAAADDMIGIFGDAKVKVIERKILEPENIARLGLLGVANLPSIAVNGKVTHVSLIPSRAELEEEIRSLL
ncbi:uroporphyrinogen decarboxylase [Oceanispirochaeta crateris]|uniref:Uroporphyrinogen decarboxylase n=1 Tax=Oceanispirochaeta crateris TaxID=2518645 RepID=A0A5C1QRW7_9SPIO|nr:uroporphyrinogen decarboxylase family protein [Oceanispirochaeta crateris]QEN09374.1 uroporphyrinogen decarboxylase [Oceanispirochaeta crateris]